MSMAFAIAAAMSIGASLMAYTLVCYASSAALDLDARQRVRRRALMWFLVSCVALAVMATTWR